jgi:16S rRNA (adenine1518-N6/adenine1519-N6)-dimethyltransferase
MNASGSPIDRLPIDRRAWVDLLSSLGIRPSKALGQNFLVDQDVVRNIVTASGVTPGDDVVEVGPGLGVLTAYLLAAGARVTAIELDRDLIPYLKATFGEFERFTAVEGDALRISFEQIAPHNGEYSVVANLPYAVAAAVIMRFLEAPQPPADMTVMVQREVANRIVGRPPDMTVLGVAAQVLSEPSLAFSVPPASFLPSPKVDSAVIRMRPLGETCLAATLRPRFFELVNGGFRHRRKQVLNSLAFEVDLAKNDIADRLRRAGIDPLRRAQTITVDEWIALTEVWEHAR